MTEPNSEPYVFPGAARPERPRPLLGKIVAWISVALGGLFLFAAIADFSFAGVVLGACIIAAGTLYVFGKLSRGRIIWATPAVASLPALVALSIMTPTPVPDETGSSRAFSAPTVAQVTTSTPSPKTTTAPRQSTTTPGSTTTIAPSTVVPPPEPETVYARPPVPTTTQYVPAPTPVYVAEPEPVYVPPAPLVAVPEVPSAVSYANCTAVRAAGAAPIYAGEPGYSLKLDRDGDGVACET